MRFAFMICLGLMKGVSCSNPVISPSPTASAVEGHNLTLTCTYPGSEAVVAYNWSKDGSAAGLVLSSCAPLVAINTTLYGYDCLADNIFTWTIKQVSRTNQGDKWRCEVLIGGAYLSSQESTIEIIVPITSVTMTSPTVTTVSVIENTPSVQFVCITSSGRPQAVVTWYQKPATSSAGAIEINGGKSETSMDAKNFTIVTGKLSYSPSRDVQGWKIYCNASNVENNTNTSSRKPTLNVLYAPVVQSLSDVNTVEGSDLSKTCEVTPGNPTQTLYRWTRTRDGQAQTSATLTITSVQQGDDDTYTCTASNTMSPTGGTPQTGSDDDSFKLDVLYPSTTPKYTINNVSTPASVIQDGPSVPSLFYNGSSIIPATVSVIEGSTFPTITCSGSTSNPSPSSYSWSGTVTSTSGSLNLVNVGKHQAGIFMCHVRNTMVRSYGDTAPVIGRNNKTFALNVLHIPVVQALSNQNIQEGYPLTKTCHVAPGIPADTSYRWTRAKGGLTQTSDTLTIASVTKSDADTYTCRAQNTMIPTIGPQQTGTGLRSFALTVLYEASLVSFTETHHPGTSNVTLNENEAVSLQCVVDSNPGSTIEISKDGNTKEKVFNSTKAVYTISQVTCQYAGTYRCTCFNDYNEDNARPSQEIYLLVLCSPRLAGRVKSNLTKGILETVVLSVTVVAHPEPTNYVWAKLIGSTWTRLTSNSSVHIWSQGLQFNLIILSTTQSDYGQYRVSITNTGGAFQQLFYILPQAPPAPPTGVRYIPESISETSATIEWSPGFNGGLQQIFVVNYRPVSSKKWNAETVIHSSETIMNITLNGLGEGITYGVQVFALNSIGNSSSEIIHFTTLDVASPATASLTASVVGGIAGGVAAVVILIIAIVLARRYQMKCYCKCKMDKNNTQEVDTARDNTTTDKDADAPDSAASYYNAEEVRNPPSQYTALAFNDTSARAYDSLQNIELDEIPQSNQQYENLNI